MPRNAITLNEFEAEQADLVALCTGLSDEQWSQFSLCSGWTVRQTVVHVAWYIHRTPGQVANAFLSTLVDGSTKGPDRQIARDETAPHKACSSGLLAPASAAA
jgi:uncharacterized protein (TIGR03083 family)